MSTVMQTSTGCLVDLAHPDLSRIDIRRDIAEPLARTARFAGHMGASRPDGRIWSVAQHCVVGAKAMLEEIGSPLLALAFLVHDAHEAFIGDLTTPMARALAYEMDTARRGAGEACLSALTAIKRRLDIEIWCLAGNPMPPRMAVVKEMDLRMLAAEARQILGASESDLRTHAWPIGVADARPVRTHGALMPWSTKRSTDEWMALWSAWTTGLRAAASTPTDSTRRRTGARSAA